jgi:tetratricopeptide (TPR) repeat protein
MEVYLAIAKTISSLYEHSDMATVEYRKAIEQAQKQGSEKMLKKIYLEQIMANVDIRLTECSEYGLEAIEKYMELDTSNPKVLGSMGVALLKKEDKAGAVEAFKKSLELDNRDEEVGLALLSTLFRMKEYDDMMSEIERHGIQTLGFWLRSSVDAIYPIRYILSAASMTKKLGLLIQCFESEMENVQFSKEDLKVIDQVGPENRPRIKLSLHTKKVAMSSMFRVYLGWLYLEFLGQPDEAFKLWKTAFFHRIEFFNLGRLVSSEFETYIIPNFFDIFAQLNTKRRSVRIRKLLPKCLLS